MPKPDFVILTVFFAVRKQSCVFHHHERLGAASGTSITHTQTNTATMSADAASDTGACEAEIYSTKTHTQTYRSKLPAAAASDPGVRGEENYPCIAHTNTRRSKVRAAAASDTGAWGSVNYPWITHTNTCRSKMPAAAASDTGAWGGGDICTRITEAKKKGHMCITSPFPCIRVAFFIYEHKTVASNMFGFLFFLSKARGVVRSRLLHMRMALGSNPSAVSDLCTRALMRQSVCGASGMWGKRRLGQAPGGARGWWSKLHARQKSLPHTSRPRWETECSRPRLASLRHPERFVSPSVARRLAP